VATCPLCNDQVQIFAASSKDRAEIICPRCGEYYFDQVDAPALDGKLKDVRHVVSGVIRAHRTRRSRDRLDPQDGRKAPRRRARSANGPGVTSTAFYIYLASRVDRPWESQFPNTGHDYPLLFMKDDEDMSGFGQPDCRRGAPDCRSTSRAIDPTVRIPTPDDGARASTRRQRPSALATKRPTRSSAPTPIATARRNIRAARD
jgi:hypothetical protein